MIVRTLTPADLEDAMRPYGELLGATPLPRGRRAVACRHAILARPGTSVLGAEEDGSLVSMATLHRLPNVAREGRPSAAIDDVVTSAVRRGCGLGLWVMEVATVAARDAEADKITLTAARAPSRPRASWSRRATRVPPRAAAPCRGS